MNGSLFNFMSACFSGALLFGGGLVNANELAGPKSGVTGVTSIDVGNGPKQVVYEEIGGFAVVEGDIVIGTVAQAKAAMDTVSPRSVVISGARFRWRNNTIAYRFAEGLPQVTIDRIRGAIAHWQQRTNLQFVFRDAWLANASPDFVTFRAGEGCSSNVGRRGGEQFVTLELACSQGNIIHEIGHAAGLWHEQSREDRDQFVRVNFDNVDPELRHNFNQHITDGTDMGMYDYGSIMHYGRFAFSVNGLPTITPLDPNATIGQRTALSSGDVDSINTLYPAACRPVALNRFWNGVDHLYLTNAVAPSGYASEGRVGALCQEKTPGTVGLYRYFNGVDHFYTTILAPAFYDYTLETLVGYVYDAAEDTQINSSIVPFYRYFNGVDHFYTDINVAGFWDYKSEGRAFYLLQ